MPNRLLATLAAAGALPALPVQALAQDVRDWRGVMHYAPDWTHMIGGMFMMVFFWGGLALVIYLIIRWLNAGGRGSAAFHHPSSRSPLDILKERYARGEIDKAEYEERKRILVE